MARNLVTTFLLTALAATLAAQNDPGPPPERSVARISVINGDVSARRGDTGDVVAAALNAPLGTQDSLLTASNSRAEIQFDAANMIRVGSNAEVRMGELGWHHYQIQVALGTVSFRVLRPNEAQVEIDTPLVGIRPQGPGIYRVTVREDGSADITAREGQAEIVSRTGSERLNAGSSLMVRGSDQDPEYQIVAAFGPDEFDQWNAYRDQELLHSRSQQYVSPDVNGAEDLDRNGRWVNDPQYGNVWAPTVEPGWAPYQAGRWVWEDYYGWTWVSNDPWGWAPYHYGRWFYGPVGWCWWPGPIHARYYWSPALVGFFGFGGGGGIGFGFGNVGWVALAPFELLHPWWGRGFGGRNFSVVNINVVNSFRNARVANGITAVSAGGFARGVGFASYSGHSIASAGLLHGGLPMTPERASLRFNDRQVRAGAFPQSRATSFYGRSVGGAQTSGFGQQRGIQAQGSARGGFASAPNAGSAGHGWERFGEPVHNGAAPASSSFRGTPSYSGNSAGGWNRFGQGGAPQSVPRTGSQGAPGYTPGNWGRSTNQAVPGGGGSQAVRIAPPIVNQRPQQYSAPQQSHGFSSGGGSNQPRGGGSGYQAPRGGGGSTQAPRSAPRSSGGGGGGHSTSGTNHNHGR